MSRASEYIVGKALRLFADADVHTKYTARDLIGIGIGDNSELRKAFAPSAKVRARADSEFRPCSKGIANSPSRAYCVRVRR